MTCLISPYACADFTSTLHFSAGVHTKVQSNEPFSIFCPVFPTETLRSVKTVILTVVSAGPAVLAEYPAHHRYLVLTKLVRAGTEERMLAKISLQRMKGKRTGGSELERCKLKKGRRSPGGYSVNNLPAKAGDPGSTPAPGRS